MSAATPPQPRPRLRADAERSIAAIAQAGLDCIRADPHANMTAVAKAAGVSRVTLYSHFPTREALLDAVLELSVAHAAPALEAAALDDEPAEHTLRRLIASSWRVLEENAAVFTATSSALPPERMREHHKRALAPMERLIQRGRDEGAFRADLPPSWLVSVLYSLLHTAAGEVAAGRLPAESAADTLSATVLSAFTNPLPD